jgi:carbon storage regulator CsrA
MLLLERKIGQRIILNDNIEIFVQKIKDGHRLKTVVIGIDAPREVSIQREELLYENGFKKGIEDGKGK